MMMLTARLSSLLLMVAVLYPCSTMASARRYVRQGRKTVRQLEDEANDLYHCEKNKKQDDDTVECDQDTMEWNLEALNPDAQPERCDTSRVYTVEDIRDDLDDWEEPCVLWQIMFGQLQGITHEPSVSPTFEGETRTPSTQSDVLLGNNATSPDAFPNATTSPTAALAVENPPASFVNLTLPFLEGMNDTDSDTENQTTTTTVVPTSTVSDLPVAPSATDPTGPAVSPVAESLTAPVFQPASVVAPSGRFAPVFEPSQFVPTFTAPGSLTTVAPVTAAPVTAAPVTAAPVVTSTLAPTTLGASSKPSIPTSPLPSIVTSPEPSTVPSVLPSIMPTGKPTTLPTVMPTASPSIAPSAAPSSGPTLSANPSTLPTTAPTESYAPTAVPSSTPTINLDTKPSRRMSAFSLTFDSEWKLGTPDVLEYTSDYLKTYFEEQLGMEVLHVQLESPSETFISVDVTAKTIFSEGSVLPTRPTLDALVREALESEEYRQGMEEHTDTRIDGVHVEIYQAWGDGSDPFASNNPDEQKERSSGNDNNNLAMILIISGMAAFTVAVAIFGWYCIEGVRRSKKNKNGSDDPAAMLKKAESDETPFTLVNSGSNDDGDDQNDRLIPDCESDMTSLYTYNNRLADDASIHSTPSFLYNMNEQSALGVSGDDSTDWTGIESNESNPIDDLNYIISNYPGIKDETKDNQKDDVQFFATDASTIVNESNNEDNSLFTATSSMQGSAEIKKKQMEYGDKFGYLFEDSDNECADEEKKQDEGMLFTASVEPHEEDTNRNMANTEAPSIQIDQSLLAASSTQTDQENTLPEKFTSMDAIQGTNDLLSVADDDSLFVESSAVQSEEPLEETKSATQPIEFPHVDSETIAESSVNTASAAGTPFQSPGCIEDPLSLGEYATLSPKEDDTELGFPAPQESVIEEDPSEADDEALLKEIASDGDATAQNEKGLNEALQAN